MKIAFFLLIAVAMTGCGNSLKVGVEYVVQNSESGGDEIVFRDGEYQTSRPSDIAAGKEYDVFIQKYGFRYAHPFDGTWPWYVIDMKNILKLLPQIGGDNDQELMFYIFICSYYADTENNGGQVYDKILGIMKSPLRINMSKFERGEHDWFEPTFLLADIEGTEIIVDGKKVGGVKKGSAKYWLGYGDSLELGSDISLDNFEVDKGETKRLPNSRQLFRSIAIGNGVEGEGERYIFTQIVVFEESGYTTLRDISKKYGKKIKWDSVRSIVVDFAENNALPGASTMGITAAQIGLNYAIEYYMNNQIGDSLFQIAPVGIEYHYITPRLAKQFDLSHKRIWRKGKQLESFGLDLEIKEVAN